MVRIVDAGGNSVADYSYDPWGIVTVGGSSAIKDQPIRYASYVHDAETNLYYLQARYYDPDNARFVSRDSDGGTLDNPLSQNAYAYGNDDPVNNVDPDGQIVVAIPIIVGGALFLAAAGALTVTQQEQMQKAAAKVYAQFVGTAATAATVYVGYQIAFAKGGKQNIKSKEFERVSDEELARRYKDPSTSSKDKQKIKKEQKARKTRGSSQKN